VHQLVIKSQEDFAIGKAKEESAPEDPNIVTTDEIVKYRSMSVAYAKDLVCDCIAFAL